MNLHKPWPFRGWSKSKEGGGPEENGGGGDGSASFKPCKGVGHPIFQPVMVGWVMIVSDKV